MNVVYSLEKCLAEKWHPNTDGKRLNIGLKMEQISKIYSRKSASEIFFKRLKFSKQRRLNIGNLSVLRCFEKTFVFNINPKHTNLYYLPRPEYGPKGKFGCSRTVFGQINRSRVRHRQFSRAHNPTESVVCLKIRNAYRMYTIHTSMLCIG